MEVERCFYRTSGGAELDGVLQWPSGKRVGIEMKWGASPRISRGNHEALETLGAEKLYVVIPGSERFAVREQVEVIGLLPFIRLVESWVEQAGA